MENQTLQNFFTFLDETGRATPIQWLTIALGIIYFAWLFYEVLEASPIEYDLELKPGDKVRYTRNPHIIHSFPSCDTVFKGFNKSGFAIIEHEEGILYEELDNKKHIAVQIQYLKPI